MKSNQKGALELVVIIVVTLTLIGGAAYYVLSSSSDEAEEMADSNNYLVYEAQHGIAPLTVEYPDTLTLDSESTSDPAIDFLMGEDLASQCKDENSKVAVSVFDIGRSSGGQIGSLSDYAGYIRRRDGEQGTTVLEMDETSERVNIRFGGTKETCNPFSPDKFEYDVEILQSVFESPNGRVITVAAIVPDVDGAPDNDSILETLEDIIRRLLERNDFSD